MITLKKDKGQLFWEGTGPLEREREKGIYILSSHAGFQPLIANGSSRGS